PTAPTRRSGRRRGPPRRPVARCCAAAAAPAGRTRTAGPPTGPATTPGPPSPAASPTAPAPPPLVLRLLQQPDVRVLLDQLDPPLHQLPVRGRPVPRDLRRPGPGAGARWQAARPPCSPARC